MTISDKVLQFAGEKGFIRARDLTQAGISTRYLTRLSRSGRLERVARGVYRLPDAEVDEYYTLAEVATRIPSGVICLLSALRFHEIGTQAPGEVWVAIGEKAHRPTITTPRLRVVRFSGPAMHEGIEHHLLNGVNVPITSIPKTVADCFKYRNKIGLDVALEALRDCLANRRCTREELHAFAKVCRVSNVMRPYMEALA